MYSKQEAANIRKKFWTTFGLYMKPVPSVWQERVNWLNYKTGIKDVYFRLDADLNGASVSIELNHNDPFIRKAFFRHFLDLKGMLHHFLKEEWIWLPDAFDESGKPLSIIQIELTEINIFNSNHWPAIISFFKPRLIALDHFWAEAKDSMEGW